MDKESLDAFFAKAEDVLTNWDPTPEIAPDVMYAQVPDEGVEDELPPLIDSYYNQLPGDQSQLRPCRCVLCVTFAAPGGFIFVNPSIATDTFFGIRLPLPGILGESLGLYQWALSEWTEARLSPPSPEITVEEIIATEPRSRDTFLATGSDFGAEQLAAINRSLCPESEVLDPSSVPVRLSERVVEALTRKETPEQRALRLRMQRNTGPENPRMLDGRRRRLR